MDVTQADIHKILPDGDELRGLVIGHYSNGVGGLGRGRCQLIGLDWLLRAALATIIIHGHSV
jgi:hypothetical protein